MPAKDIRFRDTAWSEISEGVGTLAKAVKTTLGPCGRNVMINKSFGAPLVTKDGVSVAKEIELSGKFKNIGAQMVKTVASETADIAGDGTTTATVLAEAIFNNGVKLVTSGADPMKLKDGIQRAVATVTNQIEQLAQKVNVTGGYDGADIADSIVAQIGTISANGDREIGQVLAEVIYKLNENNEGDASPGVITIEEGNSFRIEKEIVVGMELDRGYVSPYFANNQNTLEAEFGGDGEDDFCYILVHEKKLSSAEEVLPIIELVNEKKKGLLIIAEDIDGDARQFLVLNALQGGIKVCAIKAPGFGDRRKAMLEDIAVSTGATAIMEGSGVELKSLSLKELGKANKVVVNKDKTRIVGGQGEGRDIFKRIRAINRQIEESNSDYDKEKLRERAAKLGGGVAVVRVGAPTEVELKEKKARLEDALSSTQAALAEGVLPGGGVALIRSLDALADLKKELSKDPYNTDIALGVGIIEAAIQEPLRTIAGNAGKDGSVVLHKVPAIAIPTLATMQPQIPMATCLIFRF
jgi:chaperonin GroEL